MSKIAEGVVSNHLATTQEKPLMKEKDTFLWFYYDTRGREIDNIMKINSTYIAIETKYRSEVNFKDITRIPK